jgi:CheY-like chemotaxis protein
LKPVKLRDAVMDAVETADPLMRAKGHALSVAILDSELWVCGDRIRLVQAVGNLLTNAAKFTPSGGRVAVELHRVGSSAEIRVHDNGNGIAPQHVANVFDLFYQSDPDNARTQGGLGLGLSLVQQIIAMHHGDVSAFSNGRPGEGSDFVIRLPTIDKPVEVSRIERRPDRADRKRVLVVDDNRDAADTMQMLLRTMGYDSTAVYDGIVALESVRADAPDAVFLDIGLPGLTGIEVAERIRAEIPHPPTLVAMTGYGQEKDHDASAAAGFIAHLTKPVDINVLDEVLKKVFG